MRSQKLRELCFLMLLVADLRQRGGETRVVFAEPRRSEGRAERTSALLGLTERLEDAPHPVVGHRRALAAVVLLHARPCLSRRRARRLLRGSWRNQPMNVNDPKKQ